MSCKIPVSKDINVNLHATLDKMDEEKRKMFSQLHWTLRQIEKEVDDFSRTIWIPDELVKRLEPIIREIDVISIEKGGMKIDTHIYISLLKSHPQTWNITLDTWRKISNFRYNETEEGYKKFLRFIMSIDDMLKTEIFNLSTFFSLPFDKQKKWMDFRQVYGTKERTGMSPELIEKIRNL